MSASSSSRTRFVLDLADLSLNGVRAGERVDSLTRQGDYVQHYPASLCFHEAGIEVCADISEVYIAYLFIYFNPCTVSPRCCRPFTPFSGDIVFRDAAVSCRHQADLEQFFSSHPDLFRQTLSAGEQCVRHVLEGDDSKRKIECAFTSDCELDHIYLG